MKVYMIVNFCIDVFVYLHNNALAASAASNSKHSFNIQTNNAALTKPQACSKNTDVSMT